RLVLRVVAGARASDIDTRSGRLLRGDGALRALHPFPTRRSSDLSAAGGLAPQPPAAGSTCSGLPAAGRTGLPVAGGAGLPVVEERRGAQGSLAATGNARRTVPTTARHEGAEVSRFGRGRHRTSPT